MKSYSLLAALLLAATAECCQNTEEIHTMLRAFSEECAEEKETELSKGELEDIFSGKCPTNENAKCVMTCIAEKSGLVQGNQFSFDRFMESANKTFSCDQDTMKKVEEVARECERDIGNAKGDCEIGLKVCECVWKQKK
ncbi:uncharacterized protein LOC134535303 [Bacillus rossius redtenbacheri]|uniref:uncharacterized protein LOC134535303 n=1 Tax=Bacillus rossius redtenbacheri TaxID=93214 RepID=UPI002FDCCB53